MAPTYTVMIPAPAGHTGVLPVKINGTDGENTVNFSQNFPYGEEVSEVPEFAAKYLEKHHDAKIRKEAGAKAKKGKGGPAEGPEGPGDGSPV